MNHPTREQQLRRAIAECVESISQAKQREASYRAELAQIIGAQPEPAAEIDDDSDRQMRIHQNGELGVEIYNAVHGQSAEWRCEDCMAEHCSCVGR